jgi:hypothetical protein
MNPAAQAMMHVCLDALRPVNGFAQTILPGKPTGGVAANN